MKNMTFNTGEEGMAAVARLKRDWIRINSLFTDLAGYWDDVARQMPLLAITIALNDQDKLQFTGRTFDKDFTAKLTSTIVGEQLWGKVTVVTPDPVTGKNRLAFSFLIDSNGNVASGDGDPLLNLHDDNSPSYRLLCVFIGALAAA